MKWRDLSAREKHNIMRMAVDSGITELDVIKSIYNKFAEGGDTENTRRYQGENVTEEEYKERKRKEIIDNAVQTALNREVGEAPILGYTDDGQPSYGQSCIYTVTDNYGRKYRVASNSELMKDPEKYGFRINGPIENLQAGDIYQYIKNDGTPFHAVMATGFRENGEPAISYSSGNAGISIIPRLEEVADYINEKIRTPMSREEFDEAIAEVAGTDDAFPDDYTYEDYIEEVEDGNKETLNNFDLSSYDTFVQSFKENDYKRRLEDYHRNVPLFKEFNAPSYETYRFIGTPEDNALWEQEYSSLTPTIQSIAKIENKFSPYATNSNANRFDVGGNVDTYNEEQLPLKNVKEGFEEFQQQGGSPFIVGLFTRKKDKKKNGPTIELTDMEKAREEANPGLKEQIDAAIALRDAYMKHYRDLENTAGFISFDSGNTVDFSSVSDPRNKKNEYFNTAKVPEELLNYLVEQSSKYNIPFKDLLGIASAETTLGLGAIRKRPELSNGMSPLRLLNYDHGIGQSDLFRESHAGAIKTVLDKYDTRQKITAKELKDFEDAIAIMSKENSLLHAFDGESVAKAAWDYKDRYNSKKKDYWDNAIRLAELAYSNKGFQDWWTSKGYSLNGNGVAVVPESNKKKEKKKERKNRFALGGQLDNMSQEQLDFYNIMRTQNEDMMNNVISSLLEE